MAEESAAPGRIITFYSYKGGTGRTMALANTAWIIASNGLRVLVIDWDLESPGLHRYLHPFLLDKRLQYSPGVIDMIRDFAAATMDRGADPEDRSWFEHHADVQQYAVAVEWPFADGGRIDFLPAGRQVPSYSTAVSTFDWPSFYENIGGGVFLNALRENARSNYDYVLIDSRTGLSDIAGICTVRMPDVVVDCFTMSTQSIDGAVAVAKSIRNQRPGVRIFPVPMKVEDGEQVKLEAGRDHARAAFAQFLTGLGPVAADTYWGNVEIPYKPFYAYEEILAPFGDRSRQENTLLAAFERLTGVLTDAVATELRPPFEESERRRWLLEFERPRRAMPAEVVISYASIDRMWAEWIAAELADTNLTAVLQEVDVSSEHAAVQELDRRLAGSSRALVLLSQEYVKADNAAHTWKTIAARDAAGSHPFLVALRLDGVRLVGPFAERMPVDLGNLSEERAREALLTVLDHPVHVGDGGSSEPDPHRPRPRFPATLPPYWNVPQRNVVFTGRARALEALRDRLAGSVTAVVHQTLYGLGGVGKTQIALEYAHRFAANYDIVWWISAEQVSLVRSSLAELATALHLPAGDSVRERVDAVLDALRRGVPSHRWLLILDNADDPDELRDLLPQGSGHVLITSRNQAWARRVAAVEVGVFHRDESIAYLCRRVRGLSEADAGLVADSLGDLPLAVEQAAAWLAATAMPVDRYLELLRTQLSRVLEENLPPGYPSSATATWLLSLHRLREDTPAAARLLELCALLGPEPIPTWLLSSPRFVEQLLPFDDKLRDPMRHGRLIREIGRYALASIDSGRSSIQMHRLVQQVIRDEMTTEGRRTNRETVHTILAAANPGDTDDPTKWRTYAELRPHMGPCRAMESVDPEMRQLVSDMVRFLWKIADYTGCQELSELAIDSWAEQFGPDDPTTLMVRYNVGNSFRSEARFDEAFETNRDVVDRLTRTVGATDAYALVAAGGLAADYRALGNYRAARELDEQTLTRWREAYGEDHPRTLMAANNLALSLRFVGEFEPATMIDEENYNRRRRVLGDRHPYTLFSASNYGRDLRDAGDFRGSHRLLDETVRVYREVLGEDNPETLRAAKNLAVTLRKLGEFEQARALNADTLARYDKLHGPMHPDTLACELNLACDDSALGDDVTARRHAEDVYGRYRQVLGETHPFTLACANNLAIFMRKVGDHEPARGVAQETVGRLRRMLGERHPYTLAAVVNLANDIHAVGDHGGARQLDEVNFAQMREVRGEDHPDTLAAGSNLSISLGDDGDPAAAAELKEQMVERTRRALGDAHPNTVAVIEERRLDCDIELPPI
ncbi:FxSxx-COOH system tetratricopeptide repeat protein [Micromonospora sp. NPDC049679]|uniref:FxSxx-COOH system tetratricopeptide repeat protein n=1 Tax=Micromonospora sp. NPDC049679 TaxID=3155920 RepID=UPI0033EFCA83